MEEKKKDLIQIIEGIGKFMENTNKMLAGFEIKIHNLQVDIDKLKKEKKIIISN